MPKPLTVALSATVALAVVRFAPVLWRRVHALSATTFLVVRTR